MKKLRENATFPSKILMEFQDFRTKVLGPKLSLNNLNNTSFSFKAILKGG